MNVFKYFCSVIVLIVFTGCVGKTKLPFSMNFSLVTIPKNSEEFMLIHIDESIAKTRTIINKNPNSDIQFSNLAFFLHENKQFEEAIVAAKMAIELNPLNSNAYNNLGYAYYSKKQYDKALKAFERAIKINKKPEIIDSNRHRYSTYMKGLTAYSNTVTINFKSNDMYYYNIYFNIARLNINKGNYLNAVKAYERAFEVNKDDDLALWLWANLLYKSGKYQEALSLVNKAIDMKNYGMTGMKIKIVGNRTFDTDDLGSSDYVLSLSSEALKSRMANLAVLSVSTDCYITKIEKDSAAEKAGLKVTDKLVGIDKISLLDPILIDSKLFQSDFSKGTRITLENYIKAKRPGTIIEVYKENNKESIKVVLSRFKDPFLAYKLGLKSLILARIGNTKDAHIYAKKSLSHNLSDSQSKSLAKLALGVVYANKEDYNEVINQISHLKNSADVEILKSISYAKQGDFKKSITLYARISTENISPFNIPIWKDRVELMAILEPVIASKIKLAIKLKQQKRYKEAIGELGDIRKIADQRNLEKIYKLIYEIKKLNSKLFELPEEARRYALRGDVLVSNRNFIEATEEYRKAIHIAPYTAQLYFNIAMIYSKITNYYQAINYINIYLELVPQAPNSRRIKDQMYKWELLLEKTRQK